MAVNQKAVKVLNKIFDAGFTEEKAIAAMTMDDILSIQGITVAEIGIINDLQKSIKANKVISFLAEVQRGQGE
jgi:4-aminobutyrate aminotransferase-like enzyme